MPRSHAWTLRVAARVLFCAVAAVVSIAGAGPAAAQAVSPAAPLPVVRATSNAVDVREGDVLRPGHWHISPEVRPDVYVVRQVGRGKRVTFYTDVDSISVHLTRGSSHDFVILLNGRDSAHTRITAVDPAAVVLARDRPGGGADTIPFTLGRGGKMYVEARVNDSEPLSLMFDTGADVVVLSRSGMKKGARLAFSGSQQNTAFGGTLTVRQSTGNRLAVGSLRAENAPIVYIENADGDGIIGYHVFDGRTVEIDYDRRLLIVRDSAPPPPGYAAADLHGRDGLLYLDGTLANGRVSRTGRFVLDTGAGWALYLEHAFASPGGFAEGLEKLGERSSRGLGPRPAVTDLVRAPGLLLAGHTLRGVPVDVARASGEAHRGDGVLGMDVLRRFNTVIDLRDYRIYLKPNGLAASEYNESTGGPPLAGLAMGVLAAGLSAAGVWALRRRKRSGRAAAA